MSHSISRKSSLGANSRRGPQKAHIPFRGDDLERGKKTGKTVNQVLRDADDFEPFQEVLDQAYTGGIVSNINSSTHVNGTSRRLQPTVPDDRDELGELSMEIDSTHNSPNVYFNTTVAPRSSNARRAGSPSRSLPHGSDVDYDRIPSPKPISRRGSAHPLNSSRLRHEVQVNENIAGDATAPDAFGSPGTSIPPQDEHILVDDASLQKSRSMRFSGPAQDDQVEVDTHIPEVDQPFIIPHMNKKKERRNLKEDLDENTDAETEDEIVTNLQEVGDGRYSEDEEEEEPVHSSKRSRGNKITSAAPGIKLKKLTNPKDKHSHGTRESGNRESTDHEGLRRSQRRHYPPLEYWRQERVVWGRREKGPDKGPSFVPVIKEIITIPKPPAQPLGTKKRKRAGTHPPRSKTKSLVNEEVRIVEVDNPELGWDDDTQPHGIIIDMDTGDEVQRRVAFTARMVDPVPAGNSKYLFQKIFGDGDFIAGGQLVIPAGQEKPAKPTKDNTYIFYLIEGAVQFRVHRSTFVIATGGMFLVPRGNQYYIQNICERDAKLFFAQARKIVIQGKNQAVGIQPRVSASPRGRTAPRSSSLSAPSPTVARANI